MILLHGIASRHDLPLPFGFVLLGAALALVLSFVVLIFAWRRPRFTHTGGTELSWLSRISDSPAVRLVASLVVLAIYAWSSLALALGQDLLTNPIFGFVYVWMWVGLVPLSLALGQFWRATNPLRTLHRGLSAVAGVDPRRGLLELPRWIGLWPAAVALFGFGWLELVQPDRTTLDVLRLWAVAWVVVIILGAVIFGTRWIGAVDPFETYASTVARLSPWHRRPDGGNITLINPLAGLNRWDPPTGTVAVVSVLLGNTAFDSFANTSWWIQAVQSSDVPSLAWGTLGLLTMIVVVAGTFTAAAAWMGRYGDQSAWTYPRLMAGSLVPIVIGYATAHYATLLIVEGQRTAINFSDPLGRGWNVFGSAELSVNAAIFAHPTAVAVIQLAAIVTGHIVGIISAHEKAITLLPTHRALRGQWPMIAVMVGYTCAGLVLLFSP